MAWNANYRRPQNKLGFAVQLCTTRQSGRLLWDNEQPPVAVINYLADQLGIDARLYAFYARRVQTRFDQSRCLMEYLVSGLPPKMSAVPLLLLQSRRRPMVITGCRRESSHC